MSQLSFGVGTSSAGPIVGVGGSHPLHSTKIIKESVSAPDVEPHQQEPPPDSLDDGHSHSHAMQIVSGTMVETHYFDIKL